MWWLNGALALVMRGGLKPPRTLVRPRVACRRASKLKRCWWGVWEVVVKVPDDTPIACPCGWSGAGCCTWHGGLSWRMFLVVNESVR